MPRLPRIDVGNEIYHVINRANGRMQIMNLPAAELSPHSATAPYRRGIVGAPHWTILKTEGFQTFLQGALWQRPQGI